MDSYFTLKMITEFGIPTVIIITMIFIFIFLYIQDKIDKHKDDIKTRKIKYMARCGYKLTYGNNINKVGKYNITIKNTSFYFVSKESKTAINSLDIYSKSLRELKKIYSIK